MPIVDSGQASESISFRYNEIRNGNTWKITNSSNSIPETVWRIINTEMGKPQEKIENSSINYRGQIQSDPYIVSNIFNYYFINMISDE